MIWIIFFFGKIILLIFLDSREHIDQQNGHYNKIPVNEKFPPSTVNVQRKYLTQAYNQDRSRSSSRDAETHETLITPPSHMVVSSPRQKSRSGALTLTSSCRPKLNSYPEKMVSHLEELEMASHMSSPIVKSIENKHEVSKG